MGKGGNSAKNGQAHAEPVGDNKKRRRTQIDVVEKPNQIKNREYP